MNEKKKILNEQQISNDSADVKSDELTTEEELELAQRIQELDAKIDVYKNKYASNRKRAIMREFYYTDEQIDKYAHFVEGETDSEIKTSVLNLSNEIAPAGDYTGDPNAFNFAKPQQVGVDYEEIGKNAYQRIKNKIFPS